MHIKASSAVIAPSTSFAVIIKACHSRKKENALSVDKVEQMPLISGCLENDDLENDDLENYDLENDDLENDDLENDDLTNGI